MALFINPDRVASAIKAMEEWRTRANSQAAKHLWPLLSIVRSKVTKSAFRQYGERDEFKFWDTFFRLPGETRAEKDPSTSENTLNYYVEPLAAALRPSDYPHRGPWTIRVRTFLNAWHAAVSDVDHKNWKLAPNFAEIFVQKALTRGGEVHRVPLVDLAAWLFRDREYPTLTRSARAIRLSEYLPSGCFRSGSAAIRAGGRR